MSELSHKKKKNTESSSSYFGSLIFNLWFPLYFSYSIFSSPYLLKLLCFLSPLFFTTTLLLLTSILSLSPNPQFSFLLSVSKNSSTDDEIDDGIGFLDEFRTYLNVFRAPIVEFLEEFCLDSQGFRVGPTEKDDDEEQKEEEEIDDKVEIAEETKSQMCGEKEDTEANKGVRGSKVALGHHHNNDNTTKIDDGEEFFGTPERNWEWEWEVKKPNIPVCSNSMVVVKRENEWRSTLACKLYEERHSESEAMDLLWETYHDDDDDTEPNTDTSEFQQKGNIANVDDDDGDDGDDGEKKGMDGKYCCLQALKFSAIKMNLGMRKRSIVRISKVLKGIGMLNQLSKHGRKRIHH